MSQDSSGEPTKAFTPFDGTLSAPDGHTCTSYNGPRKSDTEEAQVKQRIIMRKKYPAPLKAKIVLEILKEDKAISQLASEYSVHPAQLIRWRNTAVENLQSVFSDDSRNIKRMKANYENKIESLYAEVGQLTTQLSWLKKKGIHVDQG